MRGGKRAAAKESFEGEEVEDEDDNLVADEDLKDHDKDDDEEGDDDKLTDKRALLPGIGGGMVAYLRAAVSKQRERVHPHLPHVPRTLQSWRRSRRSLHAVAAGKLLRPRGVLSRRRSRARSRAPRQRASPRRNPPASNGSAMRATRTTRRRLRLATTID